MKTYVHCIYTNLNRNTFKSTKIKNWVENICVGKTLNLFAGNTKLSIDEVRNDINEATECEYHKDAYEFIKKCDLKIDTVLLDPPYSYRKSMEMYNGNYTSRFKLIADEIAKRRIKRVVSFGYHSTFMGKSRGYKLIEMCIFCHGGAQHCTIAIVEERQYEHRLQECKAKFPAEER